MSGAGAKRSKPAWPPRPRGLTERGYRKFMSKQETVKVNGHEYVLQSVSPQWYMDNLDRFGRGKNTAKYVDNLIRNVVVSPPDVASDGIEYFNKREDVATPTLLVEEIESFLARPVKQGNGERTGPPAP